MAKSKIKFELWKSGLSFKKGPNGFFLVENVWAERTSSGHGTSTANVVCPCCGVVTEVYVWSFCGGGKKCRACNVRMGSMGAFVSTDDVPEKYLHLFDSPKLDVKQLQDSDSDWCWILQDSDSDWYWIPSDIVWKFELDNSEIEGKEYMDCPDLFDKFMEEYGHYKTGGDKDIMPEYFKNL